MVTLAATSTLRLGLFAAQSTRPSRGGRFAVGDRSSSSDEEAVGAMSARLRAVIAATVVLVAGCAANGTDAPGDETVGASDAADIDNADGFEDARVSEQAQRFPDVVDAELSATGDRRYEIAVTISSPYDSPERYADGWRVSGRDGRVLAEHDLAHHHANEQPFTRTRGPFEIPDDVNEVTVEGRDLEHGYGGQTVTIDVPR
jgi:hypothetical protein